MVTKYLVFILQTPLPEIRDFLMNESHLVPVKAGLKQSSLYTFIQSHLRVWDVLQSIVTTCKILCLASLTLAKTHPLLYMIITNRSSFCTSRYPGVKQDGSFGSESWCIAQTTFLPHSRKCNVVSHLLMASKIGNVRYLEGPR